MVDNLYKMCKPYYMAASEISPIKHIDIVLEFAREIAEGEKLDPIETKILLAAALFHDIGLACVEDRKVVESEVAQSQDKEKLIQMSCNQRIHHMLYGADITRMLLTHYALSHDDLFEVDIEDIVSMVSIHDNSKIAKYKKEVYWLNDKDDWLLQLLNEADALWMLTPEGIETDIRRGSGFTPKKQMIWNIDNHKGVYDIYAELLDVKPYKFINKTLYRSKTGYAIFKRLTT